MSADRRKTVDSLGVGTSPCTPPDSLRRAEIHVIGVRGSTEPQSGSRLLMPIAEAFIETFPGKVRYTELGYPATIERFVPPADIDLGDSPSVGVRNLVSLLNDSAQQQPDSCLVLLGYSQGAQVIGDALLPPAQRICGEGAAEISQSASDRIAAIVLFGDPRFTRGESFNSGTFDPAREGLWPRPPGALDRFSDRLQSYCARNDVTCQGDGGTLQAHTEYFTNDMPAEAEIFAIERVRSHQCPI